MFGNKKLLKRIEFLELSYHELQKEIWKLKNPPLLKGDKVLITTYKKKGKVLTVDFKVDGFKGFYSYRWVYGVLCGNDLITSYNVIKA